MSGSKIDIVQAKATSLYRTKKDRQIVSYMGFGVRKERK